MSWTEGLGSAEIPPQLSHNYRMRSSMNGITSRCELSMLWLTLSKGELGQQRQQEGSTPNIDFQFDFDFKILGGGRGGGGGGSYQ